MSKTIKVIDLLNKIANGEEVPNEIKFKNRILEYDLDLKSYIYQNHVPKTGWSVGNIYLNDEVEIIEEQQDIDIQPLNPQTNYFKDGTDFVYKLMYDKINELVQAVKQLDKKIKEK